MAVIRDKYSGGKHFEGDNEFGERMEANNLVDCGNSQIIIVG
jgi:hypothetical protein